MDGSDDGSGNCGRIDDLHAMAVGWWKRLDLRIAKETLKLVTNLVEKMYILGSRWLMEKMCTVRSQY
jgi:hypothetical protein